MSAVLEETHAAVAGAKRVRRSWPRAEKRRIVEEAFRPGASAADVARHHGLNANQIFNWRRRALAVAAAKTGGVPPAAPEGERPAAQSTAFLPIGTIVQTNDEGAARVPRPAVEQSAGMIEITLACGSRVRVDAFVNERALRRVLSVLKASS